MTKGDNLVKIYTGSEVSVLLLKGKLEDIGVASMIRNDFQTGISGGFVGGTPSSVDLYIQELDLTDAESVINDFILNIEE